MNFRRGVAAVFGSVVVRVVDVVGVDPVAAGLSVHAARPGPADGARPARAPAGRVPPVERV